MIEINYIENIAQVFLNRLDAKNALNTELIDELISTLKKLDDDSKIKVILLSHKGNVFCAGGDTKDMKNQTGMFEGNSNELRLKYMKGIQMIPRMIESLNKPIIAVIDGACVGAGCDLAMMCDLRIVGENASFQESFARLNLIPGDGGTYFLPRVVGYTRAMEMFLSCEVIKGDKILDWNLANLKFNSNELQTKSIEYAKNIAKSPLMSLSMLRRAMIHSQRNDLNTHLDMLAAFQGILQRSQEHFDILNPKN